MNFQKICCILFLSLSEGFTTTPINSNRSSTISTAPATAIQLATPNVDNSENVIDSRRNILGKAAFVAASLAFSPIVAANALDMDAFANAQIEMDIKNCDPKRDPKCIPVLNADEALCKYGQSGNVRGEACKRVKAAGGKLDNAPPVKSLGGAYAM